MVRHLFAPDVGVLAGPAVTVGQTTAPQALLAAGQAFTVWTDRVAGENVSSDLKALDGVTPLVPVASSAGQRPWLRGPDTRNGVEQKILYQDTGTGERTPLYAVDSLEELLLAGPAMVLEQLQDLVAAMIVAGANVTKVYNDDAGTITISSSGGGGGGGVTDHGQLAGLDDDDHTQYLTAGRGDARYFTQTQVATVVNNAVTSSSAVDRDRTKHVGVQGMSSVDGLGVALTGKADLDTGGKLIRSQMPFVIVFRTADQGVPTAADCVAAGYPEGCLISVDPA